MNFSSGSLTVDVQHGRGAPFSISLKSLVFNSYTGFRSVDVGHIEPKMAKSVKFTQQMYFFCCSELLYSFALLVSTTENTDETNLFSTVQ
ncbi:hypothetical protein NECAME_14136 [Necator americanus]|uniref:Uncharacterized protein n=1 Tax=Necator americanus TaxID=51031 RepID=W2SPZ3_NECAM|nr:hypothetical protein NECAME_14136 [Necator americanus]ETN71710.1 hypothetical protein NECAME_14136 [Necator americanus]